MVNGSLIAIDEASVAGRYRHFYHPGLTGTDDYFHYWLACQWFSWLTNLFVCKVPKSRKEY